MTGRGGKNQYSHYRFNIVIWRQLTIFFCPEIHILPGVLRGQYLDPSNLHMTLAFVGEWSEEITEVLPGVEDPFPLTLSHIGFFPEAKVLWAGVEQSAGLERLASRVRHSLADSGIPFDPKRFNPHITLTRKPSVPAGVIVSEIEIPRAVMTVEEVCLYRSDRGKSGMVYTVIGSV